MAVLGTRPFEPKENYKAYLKVTIANEEIFQQEKQAQQMEEQVKARYDPNESLEEMEAQIKKAEETLE